MNMKTFKLLFLSACFLFTGVIWMPVAAQDTPVPARAQFYNTNCSHANGAKAVAKANGEVVYYISTPTDLYLASNLIDASNLFCKPGFYNKFAYVPDPNYPVYVAYYSFPAVEGAVEDAGAYQDTYVLQNDIVMPDPGAINPTSYAWPAEFWVNPTGNVQYQNYNWFTPAANDGALVVSAGDTLRFPGFTGTFDGGGHTISNLYIGGPLPRNTGWNIRFDGAGYRLDFDARTNNGATHTENDAKAAFIGSNSGTIKNLHLEIKDIGDGTYTVEVGAIAGCNAGVIDNCIVDLDGKMHSNVTPFWGALSICGGIAAVNSNSQGGFTGQPFHCGTISNCTVNVNTELATFPNAAMRQIAAICWANTADLANAGWSGVPVAPGTATIQNCTININNNGIAGYGISYVSDGLIDGCTVNVLQGGQITNTQSSGNTSASGLSSVNYGTLSNNTVNDYGYVYTGISSLLYDKASTVIDNCAVNVKNGGAIEFGISGNGNNCWLNGTIKNSSVNVESGGTVNYFPGVYLINATGVMDNMKFTIDGTVLGKLGRPMGCLAYSNSGKITNTLVNVNSGGSLKDLSPGIYSNDATGAIDNITANVAGTVNVTAYPYYWGGIACSNSSSITNSTVNITGHVTTLGDIGGIAMSNGANSLISNCTFTMDGNGVINNTGGNFGGIAATGYNISDCNVTIGKNDSIYGGTDMGGIIGITGNVSNCNVTINGNISSGPTARFPHIGGICGEQGGAISNCNVTINGSMTNLRLTDAQIFMGGIAGYKCASIAGCTVNLNGAITSAGQVQSFLGGIVGYGNATDCTANINGAITSTCTGSTANDAGGIAGVVIDSISNCKANINGTMEIIDTQYNTQIGGIAGVGGTVKNSVATISGNLKSGKGYVGAIIGYGYNSPLLIDSNKAEITATAQVIAPNSYLGLIAGYVATSPSYIYYRNNIVKNSGTVNVLGGVSKPAYLASFYGNANANLVNSPTWQYCFDVDDAHTTSSNKDLSGTTGIAPVETLHATSLHAWVENGTLYVSGLTAGKQWSIYNVAGILMYQGIAATSNVETLHATSLPGRGVYIVQSEGKAVKVVNK